MVAPTDAKDALIQPNDRVVTKIFVRGGVAFVSGIRLFDSAGTTLLDAGLCNSGNDHNIELEKGERLLGIKSMFSDSSKSYWCGLTFVFGKEE